MRRIKARVPGVQVEFTNRDKALRQVEEFAERGDEVLVIFGPEGCGKTAFLRQVAFMLKEMGYEVFYLHPLERKFEAELSLSDRREFTQFVEKALSEDALGKVAWAAIDFVRRLLKARRTKVAVVADDVFEVIGLNEAAYVKALLNLIEYPGRSYENIVVLEATSEDVSPREIGGHFWTHFTPM